MHNCGVGECGLLLFFIFPFCVYCELENLNWLINCEKKACGLYTLLLKSIYNAHVAQHPSMRIHFSFCLKKLPNQAKESKGYRLYLHPAKSQPSSLDSLWACILHFLKLLSIFESFILANLKWGRELYGIPTLFNSALRNNRNRLRGASHTLQEWFLTYAQLSSFLSMFMPINILPGCMHVRHVCAWCWQHPEEGV